MKIFFIFIIFFYSFSFAQESNNIERRKNEEKAIQEMLEIDSLNLVLDSFINVREKYLRIAPKKVCQIDSFIYSLECYFRSKNIETDKIDKMKRKDCLSMKYQKSNFLKVIIDKKIKIGMKKEMVIDSWGEPEDIHRTVGTWGVHEQWIYGTKYLYFENNILTSFQD
jgi:hypothetical protein